MNKDTLHRDLITELNTFIKLWKLHKLKIQPPFRDTANEHLVRIEYILKLTGDTTNYNYESRS